MKKAGKNVPVLLFLFIIFNLGSPVAAQMITGTWKGKINRQKVEVKIIQQGDSLTGTSYYYESPNNYRRYSIKGYFDPNTNAAVWWDDRLLEEKSGRFSISTPGKMPMLSRADFNCPGGGKMMLDGKAAEKEDDTDIKGEVHLDKSNNRQFEDEWDFVIDNYTVGANDPDIIDSIASLSYRPVAIPEPPAKPIIAEKPVVTEKPVAKATPPPKQDPPVVKTTPEKPVEKPAAITPPPAEKPQPVVTIPEPVKQPDIVDKFKARQKVFIKEIPVSGDSIELRFYDNAEIDGDSISLFLNNQLIFSHIRLTANAYVIKLPVSAMNASNELTMVAENLGAIPPNTAYMVAIVKGVRHDAYLSSTEGSSAMIRLLKDQ
ncbi:MAG: hypothetical protein JNM19_02145 [Chitinophagaceae bacterium]|nr:hypothetical protein [Chitinophagaceae bacterium]